MQDLEKQGLGTFKKLENLFYKKLPGDDIKARLASYDMSLEGYITIFRRVDSRLTSCNKDDIWEHHPNSAAADAYLLPPVPVASQ